MTIILGTLRPTFALIAADSRRTIGVGAAGKMLRAEGFNDTTRKVAAHDRVPFAIGFAGDMMGFLPLGEELDHVLRSIEDPSFDLIAAAIVRETAKELQVAVAVASFDGGRARLGRIKCVRGSAADVAERERLVFPPSKEIREFYERWEWDVGEDPETVATSLRKAIAAGIHEEARTVEEMKRVCGGLPTLVIVDVDGARVLSD